MTNKNQFLPNWVSTPGETIGDLLDEKNLTPFDFANLMNCPPQLVAELLDGRAKISMEIASRLKEVLGSSVSFWITRDLQFRQDRDRLKSLDHDFADRQWLNELPIKEMLDFGWLNPSHSLSNSNVLEMCLNFFNVHSIDAWRKSYDTITERVAFRTSDTYENKLGALAAWLRQGEIEANKIVCKEFLPGAYRQALDEIRKLTREKDPQIFLPALTTLCAQHGVALVLLKAPKGCRASGATRFLSQNKALLLMSFRYLSDDHFWFTFFHESAHLILHDNKMTFLEDETSDHLEKEANDFAGNILIPEGFQNQLRGLPRDVRQIMKFAKLIGVSPGIVVGQLQNIGRLKMNHYNSLKRRYEWAD